MVVDLSMKGDTASAAAIMNRRFIGYSDKSKLFEKATKKVSAALSEYNEEMTNKLFGNQITMTSIRQSSTKKAKPSLV